MTIDEMIAVLQAAKEGKVIQRRANARFRAFSTSLSCLRANTNDHQRP